MDYLPEKIKWTEDWEADSRIDYSMMYLSVPLANPNPFRKKPFSLFAFQESHEFHLFF